jgi:hypothetical protein
MPNYHQPNSDNPVLDPKVTITTKNINNPLTTGPTKTENAQQPNTQNPVVASNVGGVKMYWNSMGL